MSTSVQYIVDNHGNKISVVLPFTEWENINQKYQKLLNKIEILNGIKDSILEIKKAKKKGTKLQSLTELLNESRS